MHKKWVTDDVAANLELRRDSDLNEGEKVEKRQQRGVRNVRELRWIIDYSMENQGPP